MRLNKEEYVINLIGDDNWYQHTKSDGSPRAQMRTPSGFKVVYNQKKDNIITYFVNDGIRQAKDIESKIKIALLTECRPILDTIPHTLAGQRHSFLEENHDLFDYAAVYDGKLIEKLPSEKCKITPFGGTFIWPKERQKIHKKTKLCSYITSLKTMTNIQKFRIELLHGLKVHNPLNIDLYGRGHNPLPESRLGKHLGVAPYHYSIAIENSQNGHYFSEKILDCFLVGTIPIYLGTPKIGEYFNTDGILSFNDEKELFKILDNISPEEYYKRYDAVKENFETAKKHIDSLSYSFHRHFKHLYFRSKGE